ncbi:hypothetical protein NDU88_004410 [Pleurodeles waltl]|uniref:G-protein coupled receptors family 1 profile domain-containing protein n=1 Tax=Pleurodeles waltl TaxID=8319 RepID=A0AAV7MYC7_PLEWA|nr:hypothetical protein NDU88_004410 [Pleurodeles waltl]
MNIPYLITEAVTALLAVTGNVFICMAVLLDKKLRTVTNYFLVSLATADTLVGAVGIPCAIMLDIGVPQCSYYSCMMMICNLILFTMASVYGLLAIAVERYISILRPFQYASLMTTKKSLLFILACWVLALLTSLIPLMGWHKPFTPDDDCLFDSLMYDSYMVYFIFFACMLGPLCVMFFLYARIFMEIKHQIRWIVRWEVEASRRERRRIVIWKELQTAISLFIVLFCFVLCWFPLQILNAVRLFRPTCDIPDDLILAAVILSHLNSVINPVVYVFRMRSFRKAFEKIYSGVCYSASVVQLAESSAAHSFDIKGRKCKIRTTPLPGR